jgi:hypothetical protein
MFQGSIASYSNRGKGGDSRYRGNCSPRFIADYLLMFNHQSGLVIDPMEGSGTTGDVCRDLAMPYRGFDLKDKFDSRTQRIRDHLDAPAKAAFCHPPYAAMVEYSKNVWNNGAAHEADLSRHGTNIDAFVNELADVLYNVYDALEIGGTYAVLLGLWCHPETKELVHLPARMLSIAPGQLVNEIVKAQHNTMSDRVHYNHVNYAMTTHEICLIFKKTGSGLVGSIVDTLNRTATAADITWRAMLRHLLRTRSTLTNAQAYEAVAVHPRALGNKNIQAKVRQELSALERAGEATRIRPGVYQPALATV